MARDTVTNETVDYKTLTEHAKTYALKAVADRDGSLRLARIVHPKFTRQHRWVLDELANGEWMCTLMVVVDAGTDNERWMRSRSATDTTPEIAFQRCKNFQLVRAKVQKAVEIR